MKKFIGFFIALFLAISINSFAQTDNVFPITGKLLWKTKLDKGAAASTIGLDGTIYSVSNAVSINGSSDYQYFLYAINPDNGQEKWSINLDGNVEIWPIVGKNDNIYFSRYVSENGGWKSFFYLVSPSGKVEYKTSNLGNFVGLDFQLNPLFNFIPSLSDLTKQTLISRDFESGTVSWSTEMQTAEDTWGGNYMSSKWSMGPNGEIYGIYNFHGQIEGTSKYFDLMGIEAFNQYGRYRWSFKITEPTYLVNGKTTRSDIITPPAVDRNGNLFFGGINNIAYVLDKNGRLFWSCDFGVIPPNRKNDVFNDGFWLAPIIGNNFVYFISKYGRIYAFSVGKNDIVWETDLENISSVSFPFLGQDGILYLRASFLSDSNYYFLAIDTINGTIKGICNWIDEKVGILPIVISNMTPSGILYFGLGGAYADNFLYALDTNGTHKLAQTAWPMFGANPQQTSRTNPSKPSTAVEIAEAVSPKAFSLGEAYPNPFNPSTTIPYALGKAGQVKLEIYNSAGQKVTTLVDERQEAGKHSVLWNALRFSSGLYFYVLQTSDGISEAKKIALLK